MPCFGENEVTRGHDPVTERAGWDSGSIPLAKAGGRLPLHRGLVHTVSWEGDAQPLRGATGFHLPEKPRFIFPGSCLHPQRESAWDLVIGQLAYNEHLPCLGFLYFRRAPLLSATGKRTFGSFFHRWLSSHWTSSFGAGRTAEGGRHRCGERTIVFYPSSAAY